jgi:hypothetical protein
MRLTIGPRAKEDHLLDVQFPAEQSDESLYLIGYGS